MKVIKKKQFLRLIKSHPLEDVTSLLLIEKILLKKRGFVAKMPPPGTDVIHLVSGGIDSITTWALLMDKYRLRVHPICLKTGQKRHRQELKSIAFFSEFFKKRYASKFVEPFHMTFPTSAPEIRKELHGNLAKTIHPQVLKNNFDPKTNTVPLTRNYLFPAFFPYPAALAALFFDLRKNTKIRTIFCSILPTDGLYNSSQTLTSIRAASMSLCAFTNDYRWQIISLCFEKELGLLWDKSELIRWSRLKKIPIDMTYTCLKGDALHCGECITCSFRKLSFAKAGFRDKTKYRKKEKVKTGGKLNLARRMGLKLRSLSRRKKVFIKDYF